jgi:16S rRNA (cytosine967-C5)-methyltransferase
MWVDELGREMASQVMAADNLPAPLFLALLDRGKSIETVAASLEADGLDPQPGPFPGSWLARNASAVRTSATVARSDVLVMDGGAQLAARATRPGPGNDIVEVGAGRGSKSLLIASLARALGGPVHSITAIDLHAFKLEVLSRNAAEYGFDEIRTVQADATDLNADLGCESGSADAVLVDAPCSGLGTLRRHPDRRWRARPEEIETLAVLGERLLVRAARLVMPGGFMVYSTCTITWQENADVVERFLSTAPGSEFVLDRIGADVPEQWQRFVSEQGWFQSLPEEGGIDGHFVARLVRGTTS